MNKLKITYFFRKPQAQYFSIEKVFEQVMASLPDQFSPVVYSLKNGANGWWGRIKALIEVWRNKGDINHITGDITFVALALPKKGLVVTYHDVESLAEYKGWRFSILKYLWVSIPVKRAQVVTAISEHTKQQLINWTGVEAHKIVVIPNPISHELKYSPKLFNRNNPTILMMGTKANKNVEGVFRAINSYHRTVTKHQLSVSSEKGTLSNNNDTNAKIRCKVLLVGKMTEEQKDLAVQLNLEVENLVQVPYAQILDAYRRCDILCFPSFYEGFGVPIVEAQVIGRPVITSNYGAMKEVAGEGAILVTPDKVEEIAQAIERMITEEHLSEILIEAGLKNVVRFDAKNVASMYGEVYSRLLGY